MTGDPEAPTPRRGSERTNLAGSTTVGPRMRAWAPKDALDYIDEYQAGLADRVMREVPFEIRQSLEHIRRLEWISVQQGREVSAAIWRVLGHDEAHGYFRWLLPREANRPVLRGILRTSIKLFGLSPGSFVRAARGAWGLAFQEMGEPTVDFPSLRSAVFELRHLPAVAREQSPYLLSIAASFHGVFDLCNVRGDVTLKVEGPHARFTFTW